MAIDVFIKNRKILNIIEYSVSSSLTTISNSFSLSVSPTGAKANGQSELDYNPGESIEIYLDGVQVIEGFIDEVEVTFDSRAHNIVLRGRDQTADFIDSSVPGIDIEKFEENRELFFKVFLRYVLDQMGLSHIGIVDRVHNTVDTCINNGKNISTEVGQTGFEFVDPYAQLKQILLRGDGKGNIILSSGNFTNRLHKSVLINLREEGLATFRNLRNNIVSGSFTKSQTERFNTYTIRSQEDLSSTDKPPSEAVNNSGSATDSEIRKTRRLTFETEENSTPRESNDRAAWESNIRRAQGKTFTLVTPGHSVAEDGEIILWAPYSLVGVKETFSNIDAIMLIESVEYSLSLNGGTTTQITLVPKDSYLLQAERE